MIFTFYFTFLINFMGVCKRYKKTIPSIINFPKQKKTSVGDTAARRGTIPLQRPDQLLMYLASAWVSAGSASVIDQISKVGLRVSRFCPFGRFGG